MKQTHFLQQRKSEMSSAHNNEEDWGRLWRTWSVSHNHLRLICWEFVCLLGGHWGRPEEPLFSPDSSWSDAFRKTETAQQNEEWKESFHDILIPDTENTFSTFNVFKVLGGRLVRTEAFFGVYCTGFHEDGRIYLFIINFFWLSASFSSSFQYFESGTSNFSRTAHSLSATKSS